MSKPRLSVLDQSPIRTGGSPAQAIGEMLELAQLCDRLGYHRYWLAEHHGSPALAGSSPEILTARVAGLTERIRVGAGGVMLTHYAPLKVAENFRMLEALFPGRIDLALGRAPGGDQRTNKALTVGPVALGIEHYSQQIQRLLEFLDQHATGERDRGIHAQPVGPDQPEVWLLGSSIQSALYAAELGLPYSFAHFINHHDGREIMEAYRRQYCPSETAPRPQASIGVFVICAETQGEADFLALSREGLLTDQRTGFPGPVPEPAAVRDRRFTPPQQRMIDHFRQQVIAGPPLAVHQRLQELAETHGAGELVVVTITYDFEARKRSYELLADAFELTSVRDITAVHGHGGASDE